MNKILLSTISVATILISTQAQAQQLRYPHHNDVSINLYNNTSNQTYIKQINIINRKATNGQPFDSLTFSGGGGSSIVIDAYAGRHGSNDPAAELQNEGFNTSNFWTNRVNFMFSFSMDIVINNIHYTCPNLAIAQEGNNAQLGNTWTIFAKNVDASGKPNGSSGDYINQNSNHDLNIYCYSDNNPQDTSAGKSLILAVNFGDAAKPLTNSFYIYTN